MVIRVHSCRTDVCPLSQLDVSTQRWTAFCYAYAIYGIPASVLVSDLITNALMYDPVTGSEVAVPGRNWTSQTLDSIHSIHIQQVFVIPFLTWIGIRLKLINCRVIERLAVHLFIMNLTIAETTFHSHTIFENAYFNVSCHIFKLFI